MAAREFHQTGFRPPPGSTEIFLVRHGASAPAVEGQAFDTVDGHGDPPLAPEGHEQAELVADRFAGEHIDALYVTPLRRTAQTAAPLAARLGLTPIIEPELREVHLGEWEGGVYRQRIAEGHPLAMRMLIEERFDVIPGAEPAEAFSARVVGALERIVADHPGERVVVVAHGGVIGAAVGHAVDSRRGFAFVASDNGSITHLIYAGRRWLLRRFNETAHVHAGFDLPSAPAGPSGGFSL